MHALSISAGGLLSDMPVQAPICADDGKGQPSSWTSCTLPPQHHAPATIQTGKAALQAHCTRGSEGHALQAKAGLSCIYMQKSMPPCVMPCRVDQAEAVCHAIQHRQTTSHPNAPPSTYLESEGRSPALPAALCQHHWTHWIRETHSSHCCWQGPAVWVGAPETAWPVPPAPAQQRAQMHEVLQAAQSTLRSCVGAAVDLAQSA